MRKIVITESEKKQILQQHSSLELMVEDAVITDWLSPDEKYVIFMDRLIEIETKKDLGDIWKNSDNLFFFFEHIYKVSNLKQEIKEHAEKTFSNRLLLENPVDLTLMKPYFKKLFLMEGSFWDDTYLGSFLKKTGEETVSGIQNFFKQGYEGLKNFGIAISKGDWQEIVKLMAAGPVWLARKIRSAAYSPVGMVIDAILIATGYGKVAQVVVWAIIVILDIYELISGDYEHPNEPMWMRILFMGIDVLGLVFAGAAAKAGRVTIEAAVAGARTAEQMGANIAKSPKMIELLRKIVSGIKELPAKLSGVASQVSKNKFWGGFASKALNGLGAFIKKILDSIKGMFKSKALKPVLVQIGLITGIGTGVEMYSDIQQKKEKGKEKDLVKTLDTTKTNFDQIFA
jgi:hypothetical protein